MRVRSSFAQSPQNEFESLEQSKYVNVLDKDLIKLYNSITKISCDTERSSQDFFMYNILMNQKRSFILIDGSNFYFKLKDVKLHYLLDFDFSHFNKMLIGTNKFMKCIYYIGKVRTDGTEKTQVLFNNQRKLFAHLKLHKVQYSLGYLLKSAGKFHEKGVDVNMAVDMLVATYENLCDHFILISSDTDLLPAIKKAREKHKTIEYIGFSHSPSLAMVANCSESRLLKREDLIAFTKKK